MTVRDQVTEGLLWGYNRSQTAKTTLITLISDPSDMEQKPRVWSHRSPPVTYLFLRDSRLGPAMFSRENQGLFQSINFIWHDSVVQIENLAVLHTYSHRNIQSKCSRMHLDNWKVMYLCHTFHIKLTHQTHVAKQVYANKNAFLHGHASISRSLVHRRCIASHALVV